MSVQDEGAVNSTCVNVMVVKADAEETIAQEPLFGGDWGDIDISQRLGWRLKWLLFSRLIGRG